jgi:hypothetical protein
MNNDTISWIATEYEHREHGTDWYWAISIITVSLAIAFIIVGNMLLSIVLLLGMGMLLFYSKHPPEPIEYRVSKSGIRAGETLYPWETLRSFWIMEKEEDAEDYHKPKLFLISKKSLMPHIAIPLNELIVDDVRNVLRNTLYEEPRAEPLADRIARKVGF